MGRNRASGILVASVNRVSAASRAYRHPVVSDILFHVGLCGGVGFRFCIEIAEIPFSFGSVDETQIENARVRLLHVACFDVKRFSKKEHPD